MIKDIDDKIRPLRPLITPGRRTNEVIRIKPHEIMRTQDILNEAQTLKRIAGVAKAGLGILKVVDLGNKAIKVHTAESNQERTVIVMDEIGDKAGSAVGGFVGGAMATGLCILIVGTPVGWITVAGAIAIGAAGGVGGKHLSKVLQEQLLFDENGKRIDTQADRVWKSFYD